MASTDTVTSIQDSVEADSGSSSFPELLYVNSKIIAPDQLSPDLFTQWYNDVHIPDIFVTSGIKEAYRYYTTSSEPSSIERPYLALYPIIFEGFLQSEEFYSIPVKSSILPGPNHEIFDVADFDARYYRTTSDFQPFHGQYLLTVQYDQEHSIASPGPIPFARMKCYFSRQNRKAPEESEIGTPPACIAFSWHPTEEALNDAANEVSGSGKIAKFKLIKTFKAAP